MQTNITGAKDKIGSDKGTDKIPVTHDGLLDIAEVSSRKDGNAKNRQRLWSYLVNKLSATHYTAETYKLYISFKRDRQDEIKDQGAFIGGFCANGKRKAESVLHRQLLTLDMDHGKKDLWAEITLRYGCAVLIYSTHKHQPDSPRYRVVIPLDREVSPAEFKAISRWIADSLGIDYFDHSTSYKPSQIMYWPSTSKDGVFDFQFQDGPWLNADEVLSNYTDWRDTSSWPVSSRENAVIQSEIKKQQDPLEKPGVVGAFCRTYDIHCAITTFLADVYEPCDVEDRYTFRSGSTSAGLLTIDDKFAYSFHGTDPANGKLCNAYDLVRIHLFGLRDEGTTAKGNRLPSYLAMMEFARKDPKVKRQITFEKIREAKGDFPEYVEEAGVETEEDKLKWMALLEADSKGRLLATRYNFQQILLNDIRLKNKFAIDVFAHRKIITGSLPWRKYTDETKWLIDEDEADLRLYMEAKPYEISNNGNLCDAFNSVLVKNEIHPLRNYLDSLSWDGKKRIDTFFIDFMGAEDSAYTRAVSRKALTAAVARIFEPGIKFDHVLTLVGIEGIQKTTIFETLAKKQWFTSNFNFRMIEKGKEAAEQLQGYWIVEIGELSGLRKADIDPVKNFLTLCVDVYRVPHAKYTSQFKRQCVFFATTNKWDFLQSNNGNRRFWPVPTLVHTPAKKVNDLIESEVDQIWAEAIEAFKKDEKLYLPKELEEVAKELQSSHTEQDDRSGIIEKYLDTLLPESWEGMDIFQRRQYLTGDELIEKGTRVRDKVCVAEIWCEVLGGQIKEMNTLNTKGLHIIMQNMKGWKHSSTLRFGMYGRQRGYVRMVKRNESVNSVNSNSLESFKI